MSEQDREGQVGFGGSDRLDAEGDSYILRLYVAGVTPQSTRAVRDAQELCQDHLGGRFRLEIVDIYQRPALARDEQIVAVPTLVRRLPPPLRKLVGDLSDTQRVLVGLDLRVADLGGDSQE